MPVSNRCRSFLEIEDLTHNKAGSYLGKAKSTTFYNHINVQESFLGIASIHNKFQKLRKRCKPGKNGIKDRDFEHSILGIKA
jgi:hypothetical protein